MKITKHMRQILFGSCLFIISAFSLSSAAAQTFNIIDINGALSQWNAIPTTYLTAVDSGNSVAIKSVQMANDNDNLYLHIQFFNAINPQNVDGGGVYIALDNDANTATGFNIYNAGVIGSEVGWDNWGNAFSQTLGNFNTGSGVTGGNANISSYNTTTTDQMISISRTATFTSGGSTIFPNNSFKFEVYSVVNTTAEVTGSMSYTFASVPEPRTWSLFLGGITLMVTLSRRRLSSVG